MRVFAHRGLHNEGAQENTIDSFTAAAAVGVDGIETDLRLSREGELVLFHNRVARDGQAVAALSREELSAISGYIVPTLAEALSTNLDLIWNLEIKTPLVLPILTREVRRSGSGTLMVSSFIHAAAMQAAEELDASAGLLMASAPAHARELPQPSSKTDLLIWDYEILTPALVAMTKDRGFGCAAYSPMTPNEHARADEWGLDLVITDFPRLLL